MFVRLLSITSLALLAIAKPLARDDSNSQCDTGNMQCCDQTQSVMGLPGLMGTGCTPITVIGTGSGSDCTQQPVCCSDNYFNGLINVGCSPINLSL